MILLARFIFPGITFEMIDYIAEVTENFIKVDNLKTALILAGGKGTRFKEKTFRDTKTND